MKTAEPVSTADTSTRKKVVIQIRQLERLETTERGRYARTES
jgi:hypothetical protein